MIKSRSKEFTRVILFIRGSLSLRCPVVSFAGSR